ncbi:hypothetical protein I7X09_00245 [Rhodococcus sp. P-2]|uniref:Eco57I restriction-modification methylase domain-containing protein n=1 Tax=Rhodococcus sp. P-2 TaxID=2795031 RepID=UPI0019074794|nr:hypothetical protein [Rhodococcus sp. P-2]QQM22017.1 hypothetical protein I7X09_00245 [Rhodococcus sp. P-2]
MAVAAKLGVADLPQDEQKSALDEAYHQSMIILFRLLFVAYAEDRKLLPYEVSDRYTRNALKTLALDILTDPEQLFDKNSTTLWDDLTQVWKVIDTGDLHGWGVPAYNGGLFTHDKVKNPAGASTYELELTNSTIGPVLRGLLIDDTRDGTLGAVDFRSLSVREFGTIYEGLLESGLGIAEADLTLDENDTYVPAQSGNRAVVSAGEVYFHSRSGSRKATGSYFTKPFAVEHLLDTALEPALDTHLDRIAGLLTAGATKSAAEALFDFRVADLAMGSAHFLVAAVDRIEARFSAFLIENPLPEVAVELHTLRTVAAKQLGLDPAESGIDDGVLLRRQIARRCIYGLDINEIAVELARLGLWIHTFVPGLPLSFLNHGLIWGNSLTGVGTLAEISEALTEAEKRELKKGHAIQSSTLDDALLEFMDRSSAHLAALGSLADASVGDVAHAGKVQSDLLAALAPLSALCDLITAERATRHLGNESIEVVVDPGFGQPKKTKKKSVPHPDRVLLTANPGLFTALNAETLEIAIIAHPDLPRARRIAASLHAAHMPVQFPEVFRRESPGFDCLLGNPPWDKVRHEPQQFWVTRDPGLNALSTPGRNKRISFLRDNKPEDAEDERREQDLRETIQAIASNGYTLLGGGHFDFAKMFCERFVRLVRVDGTIGVVLPQAAMLLSGWSKLRAQLVSNGRVVAAECRNAGGWLFENVHHSTAVVLMSRTSNDGGVTILPGLTSRAAFDRRWEVGIDLTSSEVSELSDTHVLPWFNTPADSRPFNLMRSHPKLSSGDGWITGTSDSGRWDFSGSGAHSDYALPTPLEDGNWLILKTRHVDAFTITNDPYDKQIDPFELEPLGRGIVTSEGVARLDSSHPMITYRFPSRNDDSRTLIATALPEAGYLFSTGYAHGVKHPTGTEIAPILALLGYMNSIVADWWSRRFVDRHVGARIINGLVLPQWSTDQIEEAAACTRDLLIAGGTTRVAEGISLSAVAPNVVVNGDPRVRLDALAIRGIGMTSEDVQVLLSDFKITAAAVPARHRADLVASLSAYEAGGTQ